MKTKQEMLTALNDLCNEDLDYAKRLEAYEFLQEDCEQIVDDMLEKFYVSEGDTASMLIEVLSEYKGNKAVYMGLVSCLYRGEDVALYARLLGSYGDESAIDLLKSFARESDLNYNEFMEVRNAVEELGGYFDEDEGKFADDEFYRYLKGLDEPDEDSRRSPFEDMFANRNDDCDDECDCHHHDCDCDDDCDCHHHDCDCDDDCDCHHHDCDCDDDCDDDCDCHHHDCHCAD